MDARTVTEKWETSPFDGGFEGLRELRSRRFSGAVETGSSWLFFRDGEPLAAVDDLGGDPRPGDVGAFEGASGRIHEAPHPAAASLSAMLALDGEVRGEYFTEDTPISEVHDTLSGGGFTGYVELSENVLSGDYYVVYEDGDEGYLGLVGSNGRLITDEEAEEKTKGEVGIYSVVAVRYPDVEFPEPDPESSGGVEAAAGGSSDGPTGPDESDAAPSGEPSPDVAPGLGAEPEPTPGATAEAERRDAEAAAEPNDETEPDRGDGLMVDPRSEPDPETGPAVGSEQAFPEETPAPAGADVGAGGANRRKPDADDGSTDGEVTEDVTAQTIPSVDPENTGRADRNNYIRDPNPRPNPEPDPEAESEAEPKREQGPVSEANPGVEGVSEEYESRIEELRSELETLRAERDRLRERVSELEAAGGGESAASADGPSPSPAEALAGTSLFVREGSRGEATLEDAHAGRTDRETLDANLRIEYHTQFESEGATVDGEPFEAWLRSSAPYAFVEWLTVDLLFEIQSTGSTGAMRHLYDAIPEIDRIGFDDAVAVGDGREVSFDVVARNRMGDPLVVASIDESREPTRAETMQPLVGDAEDVCQELDSLAATFSVTSSYFEPGALDVAREATSGGLLSREKYRSYVKLARKNGFHLCLVESREGSFHLAVPEL